MNKKLNRFFSHPQIVAAELFSSGWCNLECKYCYIPKRPFLKEIHAGIIEKIKDGRYLQELKDCYGEELESTSHWGTEPTLTLKYFKDFYEKAIEAFPKLHGIRLSSNFMTNPDNLITFLKDILPTKRTFSVEVQVSIDGPPFITDKNRTGGSTEKIIENCLHITKEINNLDLPHEIRMHFKPTFGAEDIAEVKTYEKLKEYYLFFDDLVEKWVATNHRKKVDIRKFCDPTLALPGLYTVQDGKNFAELTENQFLLQQLKWKHIIPNSSYYLRMMDKFTSFREYYTKHKMFTCSAGDSCFAVGDLDSTLHPCHQTFYLDHPEYMNETMKYKLNQQILDGIETGKTEALRDNYISDPGDDLKFLSVLLKTRSFNDLTSLKLSNGVAAILELADCGQISKIYKDTKMAHMLSYIMQTTECQLDSLQISGSIFVPAMSLIRLFGNGAFESILKRILKEI